MSNDEPVTPNQRVLLSDLQAGRVARIRQSDFCKLTGESAFTAERNRTTGRGCPFRKEGVRIWYYAADVLAYLNIAVQHRSTSEYDTSSHINRLSKARQVLAASNHNKGRPANLTLNLPSQEQISK